MDRLLRFHAHLDVRLLDAERVFLLGGREPVMLRGREYALVAPLIDGARTVRRIIEELADRASPAAVLFVMMKLERGGHLVEASPSLPPAIAAFWEAQGMSALRVEERLSSTPVGVHAISGMDIAPVAAALRGAGVRVEDDASIHVVVVDDYLDPGLERLDRDMRERGHRWTAVKPLGTTIWYGPVFRPDKGACWTCLARRLRLNRPVEVYLERRAPRQAGLPRARPATPSSVQAGASLAALAVARWLVDESAYPLDDLVTVELPGSSAQAHPVVRSPQCPACGDPELARARSLSPPALETRPKRFTADGGHRTVAPEEGLVRLARQISPLTGIVTSVGPVPERDHPLRAVYGSSYHICPSHEAPSFGDFHRVAMGKGRTRAQARASAVCEAIERHSALFQGDEPLRRACFNDLDGDGVHPGELLNFSAEQVRLRGESNARTPDPHRHVPPPFNPSLAIDWAPVWSLTHARRRWVPAAYCYTNVPVPEGERFCAMSANGHAAGNCVEEAIVQAFCELVERDSVGIWWYNRLRRPGVDLESFEDPYFIELVAHYRSLGHRAWVLDVTMDLGVPAFAALAFREGDGRWYVGFGCHLEARLGVQRALTELNQLFDPSGEAPAPWDTREVEDISFLLPGEAMRPRVKDDFPVIHHDDLREDVLACVRRAARAGMETLVLDQTRLDADLCAVKVIVPGLRHLWPRFGPGRLYDVPVALGLRDEPLLEADLNPVPLYL